MQKRIKQLARGRFEQEEPLLSLSPEKIELEVLEGQNYTGSFQIKVTNHKKIRGLVYTSNPYIECLTPEFEGEEAEIRFEFHGEGFIEGDIQKGEFCIICNQAERNLSFVISVVRLYAESSIGRIRTLDAFTRLAQKDYAEAYRLFVSSAFKNIIKEDEIRQRLLYEGFGRSCLSPVNMEEFLVSAGLKSAVTFSVEDSVPEFNGIDESQKECIFIQKSGWGYLKLQVSARGDFLRVDRSCYTSDDFVGSICEVAYYIDVDRLHAGKNFGEIYIENAYQKERFQIIVNMSNGEQKNHREVHLQKQRALAEVTEYYLMYRMNRIGAGLWAIRTVELMNHLIAMEPGQEWYLLMKAQAYIVSGQRQEAEWLLDDWRRRDADKESAIYAYYLYLCTLLQKEESYVNRITEEIEVIYHKTGEDIRVFWLLLFLKEEYCTDNVKRLHAIETRIQDGVCSPFLFVEIYYLYWQNPHLLVHLGSFEARMLYWGMRHGGLTREIATQLTTLTMTEHGFDPLMYRVMCFAYERYGQDELLSAICVYLVRNQRFEPDKHIWYERGIENHVRIAGLNEAYLMTMDLQEIKKIPRMVQLYFRYNSSVPYKQKAALIANIVLRKKEQPEVYHSYQKIMEEFALSQIHEGHVDDNLAILYVDLLDQGTIQGPMAKPLASVLFTHKMTCFSGKAVCMYVIHRQLQTVQKIPLVHGQAYFQLYSREYIIILEDGEGNRYGDGIPYQIERLIRPRLYYKNCMETEPDEEAYLLYHFCDRYKSRMLLPEDAPFYYRLMECEHLRSDYRGILYPEAVDFYDRQGDRERVCALLEKAELNFMDRKARTYLIRQMINYQLYEWAYQNIREFGATGIAPELMAALCNFEIEQMEYESDDFLIVLCENTFLNQKYSSQMLNYLARYYLGPAKVMARIWEEAEKFEVDTSELRERLLVQVLYTTEYVEQIQDIYEQHKAQGTTQLLRDAYCNYFSYEYFVHGTMVSSRLLQEIKQRYEENDPMTDIMKLALLYGLVERGWISESRNKEEIAEKILQELLQKQIYFGFYEKLPEELRERYQLYDRRFVEYRTKPGRHVVIHICRDGVYEKEDMLEMYHGIYVREYMLFFGEEIQYYISEEENHAAVVTESSRLCCQEIYPRDNASRYDLINEMCFQLEMQEFGKAELLMKRYDSMLQCNAACYHLM
ncbi:MAG: hypothetical protein IJ567_10925 [Lachnospiraceae bacterium]|nr:hypothetical protein [Lachnospiraceae bacterium]